MLISIVVPIYNVEPYLVKCLDSIIGQTYKNIEVILVDDGSKDGSGDICDQFASKDDRVKVIHKQNEGVSIARNLGIGQAQGDYICFIDADDYIEEDMMESYTHIVKNFTPDVILTNIYHYNHGNTNFRETKNNLPYEVLLDKKSILEHLMQPYYGGYLGVIPSSCTKLYRKDFLLENHLYFDASLKRAEDYWFNFYVFKIAKHVYALNRSFYHYYNHGQSAMKSFRENQYQTFLDNRFKLLNEHKNFDFLIYWEGLDNQFVNNFNELILLEIKVKGVTKAYKNIYGYLVNEEVLKIYANSSLPQKHNQIIRFLLSKRMIVAAIMSFTIWSYKA